ncbi:hypothetical protein D0X99_00920 [Algoriphagus lacus]|uniref:Uncharacterized protein n=2 Tax=Algoriphagus lacus TaxID=2056311 RepID=A0A418PW67_9BACT|nr:hypothetical protein D0X99_00920 [Algoriphagus lacus]
MGKKDFLKAKYPDSKVIKFGRFTKQSIFSIIYFEFKLIIMKRFYADTVNPWALLLTAKLIQELKAAGQEEEQDSQDSSEEEEISQESNDSDGNDQGSDDSSQGLVDPARTRLVDPARTRVVDPART